MKIQKEGSAAWSGSLKEGRGSVPGLNPGKFQELAGLAKVGCPISKALNTPISMETHLDESAQPWTLYN